MGIKPISDKPTQSTKRKSRSDSGSGSEFKSLLSDSSQSQDNEKIQNLFESIETAAGDLVESGKQDALKQYRLRVKEFLEEVLTESREVKIIIRDSVYDDPLTIVKIVDKKLDEIAALVIMEEIKRGELMRLIEEIKGILVDIYH